MDGKWGVRKRESESGGNEVRQASRVDPDHRGCMSLGKCIFGPLPWLTIELLHR